MLWVPWEKGGIKKTQMFVHKAYLLPDPQKTPKATAMQTENNPGVKAYGTVILPFPAANTQSMEGIQGPVLIFEHPGP